MIFAFISLSSSFEYEFQNRFHHNLLTIQLPSYGFEANGTYEISIISDKMVYGKLFFLQRRDKVIFAEQYESICKNDHPQISDLNFTENSVDNQITFSGKIPNEGVYYLLFIHCGVTYSEYSVNVKYFNPKLKEDFREHMIKPLKFLFSKLFFCINIIWVINGYVFSGFRIRLHTVFTLIPLFRSFGLYLSIYSHFSYVFHIIYYTLTLFTLLAVGRGWCTFIYQLPPKYIVSSIFSSFLLVIGTIGSSTSSNLSYFFINIFILAIGLISYLRLFIINLILLTRLQNQMVKEPILTSKIKLSKEFTIKCFCSLAILTTLKAFSLLLDFNTYYHTLIFELIMIFISYIQMRYFMFKDEYIGKTNRKETVYIPKKSSDHHVKMLVEPKSMFLAIF